MNTSQIERKIVLLQVHTQLNVCETRARSANWRQQFSEVGKNKRLLIAIVRYWFYLSNVVFSRLNASGCFISDSFLEYLRPFRNLPIKVPLTK